MIYCFVWFFPHSTLVFKFVLGTHPTFFPEYQVNSKKFLNFSHFGDYLIYCSSGQNLEKEYNFIVKIPSNLKSCLIKSC